MSSSEEENEVEYELNSVPGTNGSCLRVRNVFDVSEELLSHSTQKIVVLDLDYNDIQSLTNELCERFLVLESLFAKGNQLENIPVNIGNLTLLKHLSLAENKISFLPDSICQLKALETFNLLGNNLLKLPIEFGSLNQLKDLCLSENKLSTLPDSICSLKNLEKLDCSYNQIHCLPDDFGSLICLKVLNLCKNTIVDLPSSFSKLPNLKDFDLSENNLKELPEALKAHTKLIKVLLDNNSLVSLPNWFNEMREIKFISLNNNPLKGKPFKESFGKICKKLERFEISGCFVERLPDSFSECSELELFDIGSSQYEPERRRSLRNGNHIDLLPSKFGSCFEKLKELYLDECQIRELPDCFGASLKSLQQLNLYMNDLKSLPDSFCNMSELRICTLSHNFLVSLPDRFGDLKSLVELRVDSNLISSLPASFGELENLKTLDLYENKFALFPGILRELPLLNCLSVGLPLSSMAVNIKAHISDVEKYKLGAAIRTAADIWKRDECFPPIYINNGNDAQIYEFPEGIAPDTWDEDTFDGSLPAVQSMELTNYMRSARIAVRSSPKSSKFRRKRLRKAVKTSNVDETQFEDAE